MNSLKPLRSFNPHLVEYFRTSNIPRTQYGFRNIVKPSACQDLLDKLKLTEKYPNSSSSLDIIDVFPGYGLFSTMLNHELKPKNHIVLENNKLIAQMWKERISHLEEKTNNKENFRLYEQDGYMWETYDNLIQNDKLLQPNFQTRKDINDELLIVANLTILKFGESLLAQWLACCGFGNWLQKYGRVRMICFTLESTGQKFMAQESFSKRNKAAVKRETFTDSKIIGVTEPLDVSDCNGAGYDPRVMIKDQPVLIPRKSVLPPNSTSITVLEIEPRNIEIDDIDVEMFEFFLKNFFVKKTTPVKEGLKFLGPGADIDIIPKLREELVDKTIRDLTMSEVLEVYEAFNKWPFKPSYEDTLDVVDFEDRRF
ncbi:mitochondrial transcription factor 1 [[Candida] railenensis]|uniref:rRNA adenine N(6)-methyltransferase n=1 Tax=[Candida] railenensis TaxID=45579 RepID=A0A9P0QNR6_9ASCO|nr:mitochondrial transcription factor 1 [[Candida] railenensis]